MAEMTQDLATFLVDEGQAAKIARDLFLDVQLPPQPDKAISLIDTGGFPPIRGIPDLRRTIQVMAREKGTQKAKRLAWDLYGLFFPDGRGRHITVAGTTYLTVPTASALPSPLGEDDKGRRKYVMNVVVTALPE